MDFVSSDVILMINESDSRFVVVRFCNHSYDYRPTSDSTQSSYVLLHESSSNLVENFIRAIRSFLHQIVLKSLNSSFKMKLSGTSVSPSLVDIDECTNGQSQCVIQSTYCKNVPGSYKCLCRNGYEPDTKVSCKDKDCVDFSRLKEVCG